MISTLFLVLLVAHFSFGEPRVATRHSYSSSSYTITYSAKVIIFDGSSETAIRESGRLAGYSNYSVTEVSGLFYDAKDVVDCSNIAKRRTSYNISLPTSPFIAVLPLTENQSENCNDYDQVRYLESLGAAAVIFYTTSSDSRQLNSYTFRAKTAVLLIDVPEDFIRGLNPANSTVSVDITWYRQYPASQTFYFVVFAFSVLVLLSLTWFTVTYIRRCHDYCSRSRNRRRHRQATTRAMISLPTRKYKVTKKGDASDTSLDDPICAICLDSFKHNEIVRTLPCSHEFHKKCIDPWLKSKGTCPLCKYSIVKKQNSRSNRRTAPSRTSTATLPLVPLTQSLTSQHVEDINVAAENEREELNDEEITMEEVETLAPVDGTEDETGSGQELV